MISKEDCCFPLCQYYLDMVGWAGTGCHFPSRLSLYGIRGRVTKITYRSFANLSESCRIFASPRFRRKLGVHWHCNALHSTHTYIPTYLHACIHTYMHACMHACLDMYRYIVFWAFDPKKSKIVCDDVEAMILLET